MVSSRSATEADTGGGGCCGYRGEWHLAVMIGSGVGGGGVSLEKRNANQLVWHVIHYCNLLSDLSWRWCNCLPSREITDAVSRQLGCRLQSAVRLYVCSMYTSCRQEHLADFKVDLLLLLLLEGTREWVKDGVRWRKRTENYPTACRARLTSWLKRLHQRRPGTASTVEAQGMVRYH